MGDYLNEDEHIEIMVEELKSRNVQCTNFFDICLDYILIDSFEDLESPPSSVLAVMKNRGCPTVSRRPPCRPLSGQSSRPREDCFTSRTASKRGSTTSRKYSHPPSPGLSSGPTRN